MNILAMRTVFCILAVAVEEAVKLKEAPGQIATVPPPFTLGAAGVGVTVNTIGVEAALAQPEDNAVAVKLPAALAL